MNIIILFTRLPKIVNQTIRKQNDNLGVTPDQLVGDTNGRGWGQRVNQSHGGALDAS